jgi:hypothetical protein
MPLSLVPLERSFRATGCDARCEVVQALLPGRFGRSELLLHDPKAHEEHGRGIATLLGDAARRGVVHSGGIAIDLDALTVGRDGSPLAVSSSEIQILCTLATRAGALVPYDQVAFAIWGASTLELLRPVWMHALQAMMHRLRGQHPPVGRAHRHGAQRRLQARRAARRRRAAAHRRQPRPCSSAGRTHGTAAGAAAARTACTPAGATVPSARRHLRSQGRWPPPENEEDA